MLKNSILKISSFLLLSFLFVPQFSFALTNGILATDLLGQYDQTSFTDPVPVYTKSGANDGANLFGFNTPQVTLLDTANHRFYVSDQSNNRVLVYNLNSDDTFPDRVPDYVLGQPNFYTNSSNATQTGMNRPRGLALDVSTSRLFVANEEYHRITVYDVTEITNGEAAINVLGQPDFTTITAATTQAGLNNVVSLVYDAANHFLFATGSGNSRVMVWDVSSITNGENAINVLGQADFTSGVSTTTQTGMRGANGLAYDTTNQRLFVSQALASRVTVYNLADGITNGEAAINVLGQATFTSSSAALTAAGMNRPDFIEFDSVNQRLFVGDRTYNRVTVFNLADGITNGESAVSVLGQANFTTSTAALTQAGMGTVSGLFYYDSTDKLFVTDQTDHRVMVFDVTTITDGENAVDLLGQYDQTSFTDPVPVYTKGGANNGANKFGFSSPTYLAMDAVHHRLFIDDLSNNRILVFNLNTNNTLIDKIPDYVLGQPDFYSRVGANTQAGLNSPRDIVYDSVNNRLFVAQASNNRVSVFDVTTIVNGENAVNVLGQVDFTSTAAANTQSGLNYAIGLALDETNQRLFVAEYTGSRVKVFDVNSITDGENAVNVLGQVNFTSNATATTQAGMNRPQDVVYDSAHDRLFVPDTNNDRVLVYDVASITDGENAVNVLGQVDFTSALSAVSQTGFAGPTGVEYDAVNDRLFVADESGRRVLVFDVASITDGEAATAVLGQVDFTSSSSTVSQSGMAVLQGVLYDATNDRLIVGEYNSHRVMFFDLSTPAQTVTTSSTGPKNVGDTITIQVTFSSSVTVTGTPTLELETGDTDRLASYTSGTGTNTLTFTYVIQQGDLTSDLSYKSTSSLSLNGGTIIDPSNNNEATLTLPTPGASGSLSLTSDVQIVPPASVVLPSSGGGGGGSWTAPWVTTVTTPTVTDPNPTITENCTTAYSATTGLPCANNTNTTPTTPTVVVDYTRLCPAFTTSLRPGVRNNQVKLIQEYLNTQLDSKLPLTNFYGPLTTKAIKEFQTLHKDLILTPWNLTTPTGIWHTTTRRTAAALVGCPDPTNGVELKSLAR